MYEILNKCITGLNKPSIYCYMNWAYTP